MQLLSDVYGLPVVSSERPASFIKEKVISTIAERCHDATLRDVFKASTKKRVKEVCDCLMDSSPLYPRVLMEVLNACPSMVARSLVDKLSSAKSILKLIASMAGYARAERMWKRVTYLDGKLEKLRMRVICTDPVSSQWLLQDTPATYIAHIKRESAYGIAVFGVTYPPLQEALPMWFEHSHFGNWAGGTAQLEWSVSNHLIVDIASPEFAPKSCRELLFSDGSYHPFIRGSRAKCLRGSLSVRVSACTWGYIPSC